MGMPLLHPLHHSPMLSNQTFNFKINQNSETGQRLVNSAQNTAEEVAIQGVLNPVKGKELSSTQQCPSHFLLTHG